MSCVSLPTILLDNTETIWFDRTKCEEEFINFLIKTTPTISQPPTISQRFELVKTRLKTTRNADENVEGGDRIAELEKRNAYLEERVRSLETELAKYKGRTSENLSDSQDDIDLSLVADADAEIDLQFDYNKRKKGHNITPKSVVVLDILPVYNHTDMGELERMIRGVEIDGLRWANCQIEETMSNAKILRISSLLEDEKVIMDDLKQTIVKLGNVESVEVHCYNKI